MESQVGRIKQSINDVQLHLITIERSSSQNESNRLIEDVDNIVLRTESQLNRLESMLHRESPSSRQTSILAFEQLRNDFHLVRSSLNTVKFRFKNQCKQAAEREELLKCRFVTNSETRVDLGFDHELDTNERLRTSSSLLDDMLAQGANVLKDLETQKSNLFNIKKRFQYFVKTLGLSDTVTQLIGKRAKEDWKLFVAGCTCCLIFMFCFYYWWMGF